MRHLELRSSLGEMVAKAVIRYSASHMTTSSKRRKIKRNLKAAYGYGEKGKPENSFAYLMDDEIMT
jgi:hypothetical protein